MPYIYETIQIHVHMERVKHRFFALPNRLSCSVMNKICVSQIHIQKKFNIAIGFSQNGIATGIHLYVVSLPAIIYPPTPLS